MVLKINGNIFDSIKNNIQLSIDDSVVLYLSFDIKYKKYFIDISDSNKPFQIESRVFRAKNCRIKLLDISDISISMSVMCYDFYHINASEIRDNVIDEVLGNKQNEINNNNTHEENE